MSIYIDGTLYAQTKEKMVNTCLQAIGEVSLPEGTVLADLDAGTDAGRASETVSETMIEVQQEGWYFNTDYNYRLIPDSTNFITLPPNVLRIDAGNYAGRSIYTIKGNRVYNIQTRSYEFTEDIYVDIIWLVDYDVMPIEAFNYISLRAARKFQQRVVGSNELHNFTLLDETEALVKLQRAHMQYKDYNLTDNRTSFRWANPAPTPIVNVRR